MEEGKIKEARGKEGGTVIKHVRMEGREDATTSLLCSFPTFPAFVPPSRPFLLSFLVFSQGTGSCISWGVYPVECSTTAERTMLACLLRRQAGRKEGRKEKRKEREGGRENAKCLLFCNSFLPLHLLLNPPLLSNAPRCQVLASPVQKALSRGTLTSTPCHRKHTHRPSTIFY